MAEVNQHFWATYRSPVHRDPFEPLGRDITEGLRARLIEAGIEVEPVENWRDSGWKCAIPSGAYFVVSHLPPEDGDGWVLLVTQDFSWWERLRGRVHADNSYPLATALADALDSDDRFSDVRRSRDWVPGETFPTRSRPWMD